MKIRKGDNVRVISGKDRSKVGKVINVLRDENRITVEGVNVRKKHRRARQQGKKGEVVHMPLPISISNVMLVCSKCGKPTRIGYRVEEDKKVRVCKKCGGEI